MVFCGDRAEAAWIRAETERFVIYGEGREQTVRDYAVRLTTYDAVLRLWNPQARDRPPGRKLEVYLVNSRADLRRVRPDLREGIIGFYSTSPEAMFVIGVMGNAGVAGDAVMFHEYAHHFMLENFPAAYPGWFIEGWAEYFMTTEITPRGVLVGNYNAARVQWLSAAMDWLPMEEVLRKRPADFRREKSALYYAQSWLLMHYMHETSERRAQLNTATKSIAGGEDPVKAMEAATGMTTAQLTAKLRRYRTLSMTRFSIPLKSPPKVEVRAAPTSADDFLLDSLRLSTDTAHKPDPEFLAKLRARAQRHPGDRLAELTLARAEFAMGDAAAGEAIVRRRLEVEPEDVDTLRVAALGQMRAGLREPERLQERCRAARQIVGKAYPLDKSDYRLLYAYAFCRGVEPGFPTENDVTALLEARELAPSVDEISILAGATLLRRGRRDQAVAVLTPVANNPHGGGATVAARALIAGKTLAAAQAEAETAANEE